ncbi:MAG: hypothetical protein R2759_05625 [Bacteroidales bacterium]
MYRSSGFRFLQVNNARVRINTGEICFGNFDLFWYYIPAETSKTSIFSSSLWIGGLDVNNQLKLAALRYRQVGQDYWTGPLTIDGTAAIDEETLKPNGIKCSKLTGRKLISLFSGSTAIINRKSFQDIQFHHLLRIILLTVI